MSDCPVNSGSACPRQTDEAICPACGHIFAVPAATETTSTDSQVQLKHLEAPLMRAPGRMSRWLMGGGFGVAGIFVLWAAYLHFTPDPRLELFEKQELAETTRQAVSAAVAQAADLLAQDVRIAQAQAYLTPNAPGAEYRKGELLQDCKDCPTMVVMGTGQFIMGSPVSEKAPSLAAGIRPDSFEQSQPRYQVSFTKPFAIGQTEVTQGQWLAVMSNNPSRFKDCGPDCPVESVSWFQVQTFIQKLNVITQNKFSYRLPSEAEWEFAARAGTTTAFSTGNRLSTEQANFDGSGTYNGSAKGQARQKTMPVRSFTANAWGLYDMHGNVFEWMQDCWINSYNGAPTNGSAMLDGECGMRVMRGGGWDTPPAWLRSANRNASTGGDSETGFRLARFLP